MASAQLRIVYLTAGAGGMFCGSCMHDNTLARALLRQRVDVELIPTYTPIRTDEENISADRIFFGGLNVYLQQKISLFRYLPRALDSWLDRPGLIKWIASRAVGTNAKQLGALTVSMLRGGQGFQRKEVAKLCDWLVRQPPALVNFSNMLIAGCAPALKERLGTPLVVTLQGDDIFLDALLEPHRSQAIAEMQRLVESIDGFIVFSRYYAEEMGQRLRIPAGKIHVVPLGLDVAGFPATAEPETRSGDGHRRVGYLARLSPEKGLHVLVDAFVELRRDATFDDVRLDIAGWLGADHRDYAERQFARLRSAGLGDACHYHGSLGRQEKIEFLRSLDLLSVPTTYREPKGLFVLESLAAGVPVVQPRHGAFPELLERLGGGQLVEPDDPGALSAALAGLLADPSLRQSLGRAGQSAVHRLAHADAMAHATLEVYRRYVAA